MAICNGCGNNSLFPEQFESVVLCKLCSMKLLSPRWKNREYSSNEEVEQQKLKLVAMCQNKGFSEAVCSGLADYIDGFKTAGLVEKFDGQAGQTLVIYDDKIVIDTNSYMDYKAVNKTFKSIQKGKRGGTTFLDLDAESAGKIVGTALLGALPGGGFLRTTVKAVGKGVLDNAFKTGQLAQPERKIHELDVSDKTIYFSNVVNVRLVKPIDEEEYGFIFFDLEQESESKAVFIFSSLRTRQVGPVVTKLLQQLEVFGQVKKEVSPPVSGVANLGTNYDELIKLKELFDMGILTEEEFQQKKKELLNL